MNAMVTGGGGFLGRYLVEQLLEQGVNVRILSRGDYPELKKLGVEVVQGDLRDSQVVDTACTGIDTVFHVAAIPGVWGKWKTYYEINTTGTRNIIAACQQQQVAKLIYTSSPSVVFDGKSHSDAEESLPYPEKYLCHYPHSKAIAEQEVLQANAKQGLLTCALRPHLIWGPRDNHLIPRLLQKAATGRLRQVGDGSNLISMCYVENAAAAHLQAANKLTADSPVAGQAYFINDPQPVNLWSWINELLVKAGQEPIRKKISANAAYSIGQILEVVYTVLGITKSEPPMTRFIALQLSQSHTYSIEKAKRDFQYEPIVDYNTAMQKLIAGLQK
ncbi:MAG: NAD-dependent epimerase/dehydratase family protein [Planctomycetaceae bacterium]|nr:NAD-dependent epimerase/dehydratase family protein [Planctomycetaceae bacterium]